MYAYDDLDKHDSINSVYKDCSLLLIPIMYHVIFMHQVIYMYLYYNVSADFSTTRIDPRQTTP